MRITVDVDAELLRAVRACAAEKRMTLKAVIECALRELLVSPAGVGADAPPIPVFRGEGVQPGVDLADCAALRDIMDAEP